MPCVVQHYIANPLTLLGGFKFDLRVYVLVASVSPLRIFVFRDGIVRICSIPYESPNPENMHNARMHLSNFAINKEKKKAATSSLTQARHVALKRYVSSCGVCALRVNVCRPNRMFFLPPVCTRKSRKIQRRQTVSLDESHGPKQLRRRSLRRNVR